MIVWTYPSLVIKNRRKLQNEKVVLLELLGDTAADCMLLINRVGRITLKSLV